MPEPAYPVVMGHLTPEALAARLDQSIVDFKAFMSQRFIDHETYEAAARAADNRLLDERWKTQTTTLDAAFAAAEKARQEALATTKDDTARTDARIKALETTASLGGGRSLGRNDVIGWFAGAIGLLVAIGTLIAYTVK